MRYTVRPLTDHTWMRSPGRRQVSQFLATYSDTLAMLGREIELLGARSAVIEVDVPESGIRRDGQGILSDAKSASPAVVVAFESRHGPLLYRSDRYVRGAATRQIKHQVVEVMRHDWQHNVRAIALTLEALRAVDRYSASQSGEQYTGWKQITSGLGGGDSAYMSREDAAALIARLSEARDGQIVHDLLNNPNAARNVVRRVRGRAHPDRHGGDRTLWDQVEQATRLLGVTP